MVFLKVAYGNLCHMKPVSAVNEICEEYLFRRFCGRTGDCSKCSQFRNVRSSPRGNGTKRAKLDNICPVKYFQENIAVVRF